MACALPTELIEQTIAFHGHWCPGLATGIRVAEWALDAVGKSADEAIVAVVETDMCGVDAIQFLTGCTFGKGNLIYRDYGKNAFSFYRRRDGKAARLVLKDGIHGTDRETLGRLYGKMRAQGLTDAETETLHSTRDGMAERIMASALDALFDIKDPAGPVPARARILDTLTCASCGEPVMETRTRRLRHRTLCIPCFEAAEKRC